MKKKNACIIASLLVLFMALGVMLGTNILLEKTNEKEEKILKQENIVEKIDYKDGKTTTIVIKNVQNNTQDNKYKYTITIDGVAGIVKYNINGIEDYVVFNARGEATLEIKPNETINLLEIPYDVNYTVIQNQVANYKTQVNNLTTTKYNGKTSDTNIVEFKNTNTIVTNNPNTSDKSIKYFVIALTLIIMLIALKKSNIKKFTN